MLLNSGLFAAPASAPATLPPATPSPTIPATQTPPARAKPAPPPPVLSELAQIDQALDLARRTLVFVEKAAPRPAFAAEINRLAVQVEQARPLPTGDHAALLAAIKDARRRLIFSHPLLAFDRLLINKNPPTTYSHNCDQYLGRHSRVGDGPAILENWKTAPKETLLLKGKLPAGAYAKFDLAYDASKFVFAFADHSPTDSKLYRFFLYEAAIDGSKVRQLTGTARDPMTTRDNRSTVLIEDGDPCYLPDGGIAFVSSRSQNFGRCHGGRYAPAFLLYRADANGDAIRALSWGEANETDPSVLADGRIVYTRWEYVDRHEMEFHKLWTTWPDGTAPANFYGNDTIYPMMIAEAQAIPGSRQVVATGMGHHSFTQGTLMRIDPEKGENGPAAVTRLTPEVFYPESSEGGWNTKGSYASPYPLSEDLFLAAYSPREITHQGKVPPATGFGIYLIDTLGGRELIYQDPEASCFSPIPVRPRTVPPVLSSSLPPPDSAPATGTYLIQSAYLTRNDPQQAIQPGAIKALRFNELINKPAASSAPVSKPVPNELPKRIIGTVPVDANGSVMVTLPAGVPLQIQALDKDGMAILTERSFHYLQPGEVRSCIGCHEQAGYTPQASRSQPRSQLVALTPPAGPRYDGGLSFARTVQPVLDRACIGCHGLNGKNDGGVNLIGTHQGAYLRSYLALLPFTKTIGDKPTSHGLVKNISLPFDYYAHGGKLGKMLLDNHGNANLDKASFARIVDWLDVNAQAYGDYSFNRVENSPRHPAGEKALMDYVRARFGDALAAEPFESLVNVAQPDESRLLRAPLALAAGGWGQITAGGWTSTDDPDYQHAATLVRASILPLSFHDIDGTCGQTKCVCGSCWVRLLKEKGVK